MRLLAVLVCWLCAVAAQNVYNIEQYGAIGDGKTLNTQAITNAIRDAARHGGGTVLVPKGIYVTGAFNLSSNIILQLDFAAELYASDDPKQYHCVPTLTFDSAPCDFPLVGAYNSYNVSIVGPGTINGGANSPAGHLVASYDPKTDFLTPKNFLFPNCSGYACRPKLVFFRNSTKITLKDVSLLNSPFWTTTFTNCENVLVDGVTISGDRRWPNNDGIDIIDASDVLIQNSNIAAGDDGICLVTHTAYKTKNFVARNLTVASSSAALKITVFEGVASGATANITFENINIVDSNRGIAIMPRWGSGSIIGATFSNISIQTRYFSDPWWGSAEPIYITSVDTSTTQPYTGAVQDLVFRDIYAQSEASIVVYSDTARGKAPITNLTLDNVIIRVQKWAGKFVRPSHDWRPSIAPGLVYAPTDGMFFSGVDRLSLNSVTIIFEDNEPYYGTCYNATHTYNVIDRNFACKFP